LSALALQAILAGLRRDGFFFWDTVLPPHEQYFIFGM